VTRDFIEGLERGRGEEARKALLLPWIHTDFKGHGSTQGEPGKEFFLAARTMETLPDSSVEIPPLPEDRKIKVYSEYEFINRNLTHSRFEIVEGMGDADVLWLTSHFKDFEALSKEMPGRRINQFPCENVITIKDFLAVVCRRQGKKGGPAWLPTTFLQNLTSNPHYSYRMSNKNREKEEEDNHWIIKAWNLSRGLDMQVSSSLSHILRLPASGPKIAQKYLHSPVLFNRPSIGKVKFDVRYIILLKSVEPLEFNWLPDCERACDYYPEFFNNVFSTLFLGETEGQNVTRL